MGRDWRLLELQNDRGQTPFLVVASWGQRHSASMLELLTKRGANVHVKDMYGRDALFTLIEGGHIWGSHFDSACCLLSLGLDKYTTDHDGRSIFDVVYGYSPEKDPGKFTTGSYKRDLWFSALEHHSRSISDSAERQGSDGWKTTYHRMRSVYSRWYTPFHHRALLRGDAWDEYDSWKWSD